MLVGTDNSHCIENNFFDHDIHPISDCSKRPIDMIST
jgi:hypothetical protein